VACARATPRIKIAFIEGNSIAEVRSSESVVSPALWADWIYVHGWWRKWRIPTPSYKITR
jgi:hypothetical protein